MSAFARAARALHADPNLGMAAVFRPAAGPQVPLRVVRQTEAAAEGFGAVEVAYVLMADLREAPRRHDELIIGRDTYVVEQIETEARTDRWRLTLSR